MAVDLASIAKYQHFEGLNCGELKSALEPIFAGNLPFQDLQARKLNLLTLTKRGFTETQAKELLAYLGDWIRNESDPKLIQKKAQDLGANDSSVARLGFHLQQLIAFSKIIKDPSLIPIQQGKLASGQGIELCGISIAGGQRNTNSDSYHLQNKSGSKLIAAIADGITGSELDRTYQTGKIASRAAMRSIKRNQALLEQDIDTSKIMSDEYYAQAVQDLKKENLSQKKLVDLFNPYSGNDSVQSLFNICHKYIFNFDFQNGMGTSLNTVYRKIHGKSPDEEIPGQAIVDYFKNSKPQDILQALLVEDYQDVMRVVNLLYQARSDIEKKTESLIGAEYCSIKEDQKLNFSTTIILAIDQGENIMLVSIGDSNGFSYDQDGKISPDSQNESHSCSGHITSCLGVKHLGQQEQLVVMNGVMRNITKEAHQEPKGIKDISIKRIKKADTKGIILCDDGICTAREIEDQLFLNGNFNYPINNLTQQALVWANNHENGDDKTIVVVELKE